MGNCCETPAAVPPVRPTAQPPPQLPVAQQPAAQQPATQQPPLREPHCVSPIPSPSACLRFPGNSSSRGARHCGGLVTAGGSSLRGALHCGGLFTAGGSSLRGALHCGGLFTAGGSSPPPTASHQAHPPLSPSTAQRYLRPPADAPASLREFTTAEMVAATSNFARVLGEGGFGRVYHGHLSHPAGPGGCDVEVAVKVMAAEHITGGMSSFQVEVAAMTAMQHPKILQLLGYVGDSPSPVLVYEFIPRGDCTDMLKLSAKGEVAFPWRARLVVALGCAEALAAIHDANFVHRDFKASNVLLREDLTPVLADFGLAKSVTDWATHVSTRVMGSMGYMDPIYFQTGQLSRKSDTYAFGVFLLELVSGCLALDDRFQELRKLVVAKTFPDPELVVDPRIKGEWTKKQVYIVFTLIRFAIFFDWDNRPSMSVMRDKLRTVVE
ncbi:unnamed protein product [Closterium sp. Naga37s-1]|nr:unnamed protein product [Closterium sp. Naga37s-1]